MDDVVRIGAAAQALGVSVDTLRRWEREGRVQFERRGYSRSRCTRIREIEHAGESNERERPVGEDRGFLWRLNAELKLRCSTCSR